MSEEEKRSISSSLNEDENSINKIIQDKTKSVEEIAALLTHQQQSFAKSNENVIVSNFVKYFEPLVQNLDSNVEALRLSQYELSNQIKSLLNQISVIYEDEKKKLDLDDYTKRLIMTKKRLNTVQATIISVQERLNRIYLNIQKDPYLRVHKEQQQKQQQQEQQQNIPETQQ